MRSHGTGNRRAANRQPSADREGRQALSRPPWAPPPKAHPGMDDKICGQTETGSRVSWRDPRHGTTAVTKSISSPIMARSLAQGRTHGTEEGGPCPVHGLGVLAIALLQLLQVGGAGAIQKRVLHLGQRHGLGMRLTGILAGVQPAPGRGQATAQPAGRPPRGQRQHGVRKFRGLTPGACDTGSEWVGRVGSRGG